MVNTAESEVIRGKTGQTMRVPENDGPSAVDSDSTLTSDTEHNPPLTVEKVIETLNSALTELEETKDYITYATLIDIHLQGRQSEFDPAEKAELLKGLYDLLKAHPDIVYEIGWDLPQLLIDYLISEQDIKFALRESHGIMSILKIFELLCLEGNPKELFLRGCELLNATKFSEMELPIPPHYQRGFYEKLITHSLMELIFSSMKRIRTRYASRFLSKVIVTYVNFLHSNATYPSFLLFVFRRYYIFARQYSGMPLPADDESDDKSNELAEVLEDEGYLQRKLLSSFLTHYVSIAVANIPFNWSYLFYKMQFHNPKSKFRLPDIPILTGSDTVPENQTLDGFFKDAQDRVITPISDDESWDAVLLRCSQLAQSMDLDLEELFKSQFEAADELFSNLDTATSMHALNDEVYTLAINDYNKRTKLQKAIPLSDDGLGYLMTHLVIQDTTTYNDKGRIIDISADQMVKWTLRNLIPTLIDPSLSSLSLVDCGLFWAWYVIKYNDKFKEEISKVQTALLYIYLQIWISISSQCANAALRIIMTTLITKVLTLADETFSYNFMVETLETCPFDNARAAIIGILKDLLIRPKNVTKTATKELTNSLASLSVSGEGESSNNDNKPELPPRENVPTYINATAERRDQLVKIFDGQLNEFFAHKSGELDRQEMSILLSFLNLFIAIKKQLKKEQIETIVENVESKVKAFKEANEDKKEDHNVTQVEFLLVATESLGK